MKSIIPLIAVMACVLLAINLAAVAGLSIEDSRWARIITAGAFIWAYSLHFSKNTLFLLAALTAFFIADIFTLSYDLDLSKNAYFILHGIAFLFLSFHITKGADRALLSRFQKLFILLTFVLSLAILLALGFSFQDEIEGYWHVIFFYFHGLSAVICLISALGFYDSRMNSVAMCYLLAAFALIFSDLTAFPAYYLDAEGFYYIGRIFYVLGLASLVQFSFHPVPSQSTLAEEAVVPKFKTPKVKESYHEH